MTDTIIIYNNKKGLIKINLNVGGIGVLKLPIQKKQESQQDNKELWQFLGVSQI